MRYEELVSDINKMQVDLSNKEPLDYLDTEHYNDMLDEANEEVVIGGITFAPSRVLKELDPIAYESGRHEYADSFDLGEFDQYCDELHELREKVMELLENHPEQKHRVDHEELCDLLGEVDLEELVT